jgi:predicted ATPase
VGREEEIAEARRLLERSRLLTLTGAGGTGKSRLALQVAAELQPEYRDGAFFAGLSSVTDPALVPAVLARVLRVPEAPGRSILEALADHLRDRRLLLVADNFEQVTDAGPVLEQLLAAAPGLDVLVTSRVALSLRGEQELVVPPLDPPEPGQAADLEALGRSEAVRLVTERAQAVQPGFEPTEQNAQAVAGICARLQRSLTLLTGGARPSPTASGPCAAPSPGAASCWRPPSGGCSPGCRCSPAAGRWRRPRPSATPARSASTRST